MYWDICILHRRILLIEILYELEKEYMKNRIFCSFLIAISVMISILLSGCDTSSSQEQGGKIEKNYDYACFQIQAIEDHMVYDCNVLTSGDTTYICSLYISNNGSDDFVTRIEEIGKDGSIVSQKDYSDNVMPDSVIDGKFVFVTIDNEIVFSDPESGDVCNVIDLSSSSYIQSVHGCSDGVVVFTNGQAAKYSLEGTLLSSISNYEFGDFLSDYSYFEYEGQSFAFCEQDFNLEFWCLDFENSKAVPLFTNDEIGLAFYDCYGKYAYNGDGIFEINPLSKTLTEKTNWNCIDIRPENNTLYYPSRYFPLTDDSFAKSYIYRDGSGEVLIYRFDENVKPEFSKTITIGGYGVKNDLSVRWAQFLFNSSHNDVHVVLDDYSKRFAYTSNEEASLKNTELLSYFNDGNAPDVYYGFDFDYDYFGRSGMVADLSSYFQNDPDFKLEDLSVPIMDCISGEECYQLFSSYSIHGYFGLADVFENQAECSINDIQELVGSNVLFGSTCSTDIADSAVRYSMHDRYADGDCFSSEDLEEILTYAVDYGISSSEQSSVVFNDYQSVANGDYLMCFQNVSSLEMFYYGVIGIQDNFIFLGYPSVDTSYHVLRPNGLVAISSSTEYGDYCWEFIKYMFSDEVQTILLANGSIPVKDSILQMYADGIENPNSISSENTVMKNVVEMSKEIPKYVVSNWFEIVYSVDTVEVYDWGVTNIVWQEVDTYYSQDKPVEEIALSLQSRLDLYMNENYQ